MRWIGLSALLALRADSLPLFRPTEAVVILNCPLCGRVDNLSDEQCRAIRADLARLGPAAARIHECRCKHYQFVIALAPAEIERT